MISREFFDENLNNLATVARCLYCLLWTELANESNFVILCVMYLWPWGTNMLRPSPWRLLISTNSYKVAAYSGLSGKKTLMGMYATFPSLLFISGHKNYFGSFHL